MAEEQKENIRTRIAAQSTALFAAVGGLTKVQRLLICLVTFAVMGGGYYYFFFAPRHEALTAARAELKLQEEKLRVFKRKAKALARYEAQMAEVREAFNIAMEALPDKKELPSLLTGISKAGQRAGLTFSLFQPTPVVNKEFYKEIPLSLVVSGRYHQMADFFFQVSGLNRIVNIQNVTIKADNKTPGQLTMRCSAVTYMFSEQPAAEQKGKKGRRKKT